MVMTILFVNNAFANNLVLYANNKTIHSSTDGLNWTLIYNGTGVIPANEQIVQIVTSQDGAYIYALSTPTSTPFASHLIRSSNYGATFNVTTITNYSRDIATDYTGQFVIASSGLTINPPQTYRSANFGLTFTQITTPTQGFANALIGVTMSTTGQYVGLVGSAGSSATIISSDYGVSYTNYNIAGAFTGVCTSDGIDWYVTRPSLSAMVNNGSIASTWLVRGSGVVPATTQVTFPCYGNVSTIHNQHSFNHLANVTTHNTTFAYIVGNEGLTLLYAINGTSLVQSTDYGVTYTPLLSTVTPLTAIALTPQSFNQSSLHIPLCIDNSTLCTFPFEISGFLYCNLGDNIYCPTGCVNTNVTGNLTGSCNPSTCTNECNVIGETVCDSTTSFSVCGNYDTDPCLEYNTGYGCLSGNICSAGACVSNTALGLSNNTAFTVTPYSVSDESTTYTVDAVNKRVTIDTKNFIQVQQFSTNTNDDTTLSSRTCNYVENNVYNDVVPTFINTSKTVSFNTIGTTGYVQLVTVPQNGVEEEILIKDSIGNVATNLSLIRNSSLKEVCLYDNGNVTYCDYSVNSYDDLQSVDLTLTYEFQSQTYTIKSLFNRQQDNTINTNPKVFTVNDIASAVITSTNATYQSSKVSTFTQPSPLTTTLRGDYNYLSCTYSTTGCRVVRTYNNNLGLSDFTNYYDYTVCVNTLSATSITNQNATNNLPSLSAGAKIFIILAIIFVTLIAFSIAGYSLGNGALGMGIGASLSVFILIVSAVPDAPFIGGFVPVWIVVLLAVLIVLIAILMLGRFTDSGGANG